MKRSAINEILGHTRQFFSLHDVHLPPFASFPPTQWRKLDPAAWREVFDLKLGWDVTAFGGNNFAAQGLTPATGPVSQLLGGRRFWRRAGRRGFFC